MLSTCTCSLEMSTLRGTLFSLVFRVLTYRKLHARIRGTRSSRAMRLPMLCHSICLAVPSHHTSSGEAPVSPTYWSATTRLSGVVYALQGASSSSHTGRAAADAADFTGRSMTNCCRRRRIAVVPDVLLNCCWALSSTITIPIYLR